MPAAPTNPRVPSGILAAGVGEGSSEAWGLRCPAALGTFCSVNFLPAGQDGLLDEGEDEEDAGALAPLSLGEIVGDDVI